MDCLFLLPLFFCAIFDHAQKKTESRIVIVRYNNDNDNFIGLKVKSSMEFDKEKVDEMTLALLNLVMFDEKHGPFTWKGFDWETMNRLYEKGYINNPKGKTKSVRVSAEGHKKAEELFKKYFLPDSNK
jgi:hypothetical protein